MRRKDREVTSFDGQVEILCACDVCRLAISNGAYPYILPLNFGMEVTGGKLVLYFHGAAEGTKYELLEKNPNVSFEADCGHRLALQDKSMSCTMEYRSVIGQGTVSFVPEAEKEHALDLIMAHYHAEQFAYSHAPIPHTTVFCLTVTHMTGKERNVLVQG